MTENKFLNVIIIIGYLLTPIIAYLIFGGLYLAGNKLHDVHGNWLVSILAFAGVLLCYVAALAVSGYFIGILFKCFFFGGDGFYKVLAIIVLILSIAAVGCLPSIPSVLEGNYDILNSDFIEIAIDIKDNAVTLFTKSFFKGIEAIFSIIFDLIEFILFFGAMIYAGKDE